MHVRTYIISSTCTVSALRTHALQEVAIHSAVLIWAGGPSKASESSVSRVSSTLPPSFRPQIS
jgi:hypothetical protein